MQRYSINTYKSNVCLIVPEEILSQSPGLSPSQLIRHIVKILVNCRHNLTNHASGYI